MIDLTVIILTYNEESNLRACITSIQSVAKRILVVDSFSTDQTIAIAQEMGADILSNKFINHANQFQFAMDHGQIDTHWVMRLDADERLTQASSEELVALCQQHEKTDVNGIIVRFEVNFLGRKLKHGGIYPFYKLIVFKYGKAKMEQRLQDEHIYLLEGKSIKMNHDSLHEDYKNLTFWIDKHNRYSSNEMKDLLKQDSSQSDMKNLHWQARLKRLIKYNIYYKLPMGLRAHLYYIFRYYVQLGFLDGKEGKIFAFMQAYWYRFLVDAKIYEYRKNEKNA